jgi:aspartate kinase
MSEDRTGATGTDGRADPPRGLRILKFGGASLEHPDEAVAWVRRRRADSDGLVVVVSARQGVTDRLLALLEPSATPEARAQGLAAIGRQYAEPDPEIRRLLAELGQVLGPRIERGSIDESTRSSVLAIGERLSARWFARRLSEAGIPAEPLDADAIGLVIEPGPVEGEFRLSESRTPVRGAIERTLWHGGIPVVTGFFGRGPEGNVRLLGRGGSDTTATALGHILHASEVELVKEDGPIRTADPRLVPEARPIRAISYDDAERIAIAGARVLHRAAIAPARTARLPIRVSSRAHPSVATIIGADAPALRAVVLGPIDPDPAGPGPTVTLRLLGTDLPARWGSLPGRILDRATEVRIAPNEIELRFPRSEGIAAARALHRHLVEESPVDLRTDLTSAGPVSPAPAEP